MSESTPEVRLTEAERAQSQFQSFTGWDLYDEAAVERIVAKRLVDELREAAADPALRLSGHSGISITRLRARAGSYTGQAQADD